jgi:endo-1,4-beta-xylanase
MSRVPIPRARRSWATALGCLVLTACGSENDGNGTEPPARVPLRVLAEVRSLGIGAAADRSFHLTGDAGNAFRAVLADEFNVLTPENDLKHERLQPGRGVFDFARADALVQFAEANDMRVRGHTLVWHRQLASWLTSGSWAVDTVKALLQDHITNVVRHFRGRIAAWDVVNEALADDGSLRSGFWYDHLGREYVELAFQWARAEDPDAALFYNDYSLEWGGAKTDSAYALLSDLVARGVPVDGIGFQAHFAVGQVPSRDDLVATFSRFAALGLLVHLTELDVRLPLPVTSENLATQAEDFARVVGVCLATSTCDTVVLWGVTDADSWVPATFPGYGQALIFDSQYRPKPAYWAIHDLLD